MVLLSTLARRCSHLCSNISSTVDCRVWALSLTVFKRDIWFAVNTFVGIAIVAAAATNVMHHMLKAILVAAVDGAGRQMQSARPTFAASARQAHPRRANNTYMFRCWFKRPPRHALPNSSLRTSTLLERDLNGTRLWLSHARLVARILPCDPELYSHW